MNPAVQQTPIQPEPTLLPPPDPIPPVTEANGQVSTTEQFRQLIEVEVLKVIKDLAETGTADDEKIKEIAKLALDTVQPGMSMEELYQAASKLDDKHAELAPVVFKIMQAYEEKFAKQAIDQVSNLVRAGSYDDAQDLVKKILQFKIAQ